MSAKILAATAAITLAVICVGNSILSRGDTLYDCSFQLRADKDSYKVGEKILLTAEIIPKASRRLTLSADLYRNIRVAGAQDVKEGLYNEGRPVTYRLSPAQPLRFQIDGKIVEREDHTIWMDLGDYGKEQIKDGKFPSLRFRVLPYRIPPADSVEWSSSNELQLQLIQ